VRGTKARGGKWQSGVARGEWEETA
jgi:hypothetical protein